MYAADHPDLASMLFAEPSSEVPVPSFSWGHGGLHGGVALSMAAALMAASAPEHPLRSVTAQFHRPIRDALALDPQVVRSGRTAAAVQVVGSVAGQLCLTASAVLGSDQHGVVPAWAPEVPDVPLPDMLAAAQSLEERSPVLGQLDVRPVTSLDPYSGSSEASMIAWLRIRNSDKPVTPSAVVFFLDALPPSYTSVLTPATPRPVPTVEFSVHLGVRPSSSWWVLVRSRTVGATGGGWVTEMIDAWDIDGTHLGRAQQLRVALSSTSSNHAKGRQRA